MNDVYAAMNSWRPTEFSWGRFDCCQFVAHVLREMTGRDLIPWRYTSEREAEHIIDSHGGLTETVTAVLGADPVRVDALKSGDPVVWVGRMNGQPEIGLGIVLPQAFAWVHHRTARIGSASLRHCTHGWRVV